MDYYHHLHRHDDPDDHWHHGGASPSLNRLAFSATLHCLTGYAIGEVLGMVIGTTLGWSTGARSLSRPASPSCSAIC